MFISVFIERVEVVAKSAQKHHRILWNHSDLTSQCIKIYLRDIYAINLDFSTHQLDYSSQNHADS